MQLPIYQVDAFASHAFAGNPAAVVPLDRWLDASIMQAIAAENNLSETAFVVDERGHYRIRWFTPTSEVRLCGHATLASAYVLFNCLGVDAPELLFQSCAGELRVLRRGDQLVLDLPAEVPHPGVIDEAQLEALGLHPREVWRADYQLLIYDTQAQIIDLAPDMRQLVEAFERPVIVSAPGEQRDFVSRFFAPMQGIDEDPVTGSAHCILVPYWAERLDRNRLTARQLSARGGELSCELRGQRVWLAGDCTLYLEGTIRL